MDGEQRIRSLWTTRAQVEALVAPRARERLREVDIAYAIVIAIFLAGLLVSKFSESSNRAARLDMLRVKEHKNAEQKHEHDDYRLNLGKLSNLAFSRASYAEEPYCRMSE